ncbi:hypothetical protein N8913_05050 [Litoricola sp.]|nr:hypothetical protein [Litorivicinus sp.]
MNQIIAIIRRLGLAVNWIIFGGLALLIGMGDSHHEAFLIFGGCAVAGHLIISWVFQTRSDE